MPLIGKPAPAFDCPAYVRGTEVKQIALSSLKGKWVVLFFYPRDFTFICPTELKGFAAAQNDFDAINTALIAASTDSAWAHKAWFERDLPDVTFPVLADTSLQLTRDYGVLIEETGTALRGTFVIDQYGVLRYMVVSDLNVGRSVEETLRVVKALQTGELCPVAWKPGESTLGKA